VSAHHLELEAAIESALARNTDAGDELLVLADILLAEGDPRGELIALQSPLTPISGTWARLYPPRTIAPLGSLDGRLLSEAARHAARHHDHFFGPLSVIAQKPGDRVDEVEWRRGFWRALHFAPLIAVESARSRLAAALAHPSARFLRSLRIGTPIRGAVASIIERNMGPIAGDLTSLLPPALPSTIRELYLGDFTFPGDNDLSWTEVGDLSNLPALAHVETLTLQGAFMLGSPLDLPHLRSLEIITPWLSPVSLRALSASSLPALETLNVWIGGASEGFAIVPTLLAELLSSPTLANLRHLGLRNCLLADELIPILAQSALLPHLHTLDLSLGALTPHGANQLLTHRAAFSHLHHLDLSENLLEAPLPTICRSVTLSAQRPLAYGRHVAIEE
jgi:hypothetical protein